MNLNIKQLLLVHEIIPHLNEMCEEYFKIMVKQGSLMKGLWGLKAAVNRLNKAQVGITKLHTIFLKACIKAKMFKFGLSVVNAIPCGMKKEFSKLIFASLDKLSHFYRAPSKGLRRLLLLLGTDPPRTRGTQLSSL